MYYSTGFKSLSSITFGVLLFFKIAKIKSYKNFKAKSYYYKDNLNSQSYR